MLVLVSFHVASVYKLSSNSERPVTDYGDENPLLYDYFGFSPELYKLKFKSRGDAELSQRIVQLYQEVVRHCSAGFIYLYMTGRPDTRRAQLQIQSLEAQMGVDLSGPVLTMGFLCLSV